MNIVGGTVTSRILLNNIAQLSAAIPIYRNFAIENGINHNQRSNFLQLAPKQEVLIQRSFTKGSVGEWVLNKIGWRKKSKPALRIYSVLLYEKVSDEVDFAKFLIKFNLPNTFSAWFVIMEIHLYMLMVRAMAEEENPVFIRNAIVEAMYKDCGQRAKQLSYGKSSTMIREQMQELVEQFKYGLIAYDEGMKDDKILASAIWYRVFNGESDKYDDIESLVKYMRENMCNLDKLNSEEFLQKRSFKWANI